MNFCVVIILLTIVSQFILEHITHIVLVALLPKIDAESDESDDEESEDDAASDEQVQVLLYELGHNITVFVNCHWIRLICPLGQVYFTGIMAIRIDIILEIEYFDVFIAESGSDSECTHLLRLNAIHVKVGVVFLKVKLTSVECLNILGVGVREHSKVALAYLLLIIVKDPFRWYEHFAQFERDHFFHKTSFIITY